MKEKILQKCKSLFPSWNAYSLSDFTFDDPKGFSSFTMGVHCLKNATPQSVLYRQLEGKENAILDYSLEKEVFIALGLSDIAVSYYYYDESCRIENFVYGRSLTVQDLYDSDVLRQIADNLYVLHQIKIPKLPEQSFFELLHEKWGKLAKLVLEEQASSFPPNEQEMCIELKEIYSQTTLEKVKKCMPNGALSFCHNDTYHGNIMKLDTGEIKIFDFEFSCLNYKCYDFSNLFAETVMKHKQEAYPFFKIAPPEFGSKEIAVLINFYLDNYKFESVEARAVEFELLLNDTMNMLILSDYKYALAAIPLALNPQQKIKFIPYAYQRFNKFLKAYENRFGQS
jgi:thiamine kinase-like enzyme